MTAGSTHITDFHSHAFPDRIARAAVEKLAADSHLWPFRDGTISSLLASMDGADIERSVILSVATKPDQFDSILAWSRAIASDRIVPFLSVHPADPRAVERVRIVAAEGFTGVKLHPYYQDFDLDDPAMDPAYGEMEKRGLVCVAHTGFDVGFPFEPKASPARVVNVVRKHPGLRFVATHLGGWRDWERAAEMLPASGVWVDTAFALESMRAADARRLVALFPPDKLLFGTDSPWGAQGHSLDLLRGLGLAPSPLEAALSANARGLLGL